MFTNPSLRDEDHVRNDVEFAIALSLVFCGSMIINVQITGKLFSISQKFHVFFIQHIRSDFACDVYVYVY